MRTLFHIWLHPHSRKVRLALGEKNLRFEAIIEKTWERRTEFMSMNPAGDVPLMVEEDGTILSNSTVICEYLEEVYPEYDLLGLDPVDRAEVTEYLVGEKMMKRFLKLGEPHGPSVRAGHANIHYHLDYIAYLIERRRWLAGDQISYADLAAAAHLSSIDYMGDVPWDEHPIAKAWFLRLKSRPSFKPLLSDRVPGYAPVDHYAKIDF
jgi:glutathione S-transferase